MSEEEGQSRGVTGDQQYQYHYGTFQGVANYHLPPQPHQLVIGFPQPAPPPGATPYAYGYQGVPDIGTDSATGTLYNQWLQLKDCFTSTRLSGGHSQRIQMSIPRSIG